MKQFCKNIFKIVHFQLFACVLLINCTAALAAPAALMDIKAFYSPELGNYAEVYLMVFGKNLHYKAIGGGKFQSALNAKYTINRPGDTSHIASRVIHIEGPETTDTLHDRPDFLDLQRFVLPKGEYQLSLELQEVVAPVEVAKSGREFSLSNSAAALGSSDIELLTKYKALTAGQQSIFAKSGAELVPFVSEYYSENAKSLTFYAEVYNLPSVVADTQKVLVTYAIKNYEGSAVVNNLSTYTRQTVKAVLAIVGKFNIEKVPTGNYWIEVEVRDRNNHLLIRKRQRFYKKTKQIDLSYDQLVALAKAKDQIAVDDGQDEIKYFNIHNRDSLVQLIRSLAPIADGAERNFITNDLDNTKNANNLAQFFFNFWKIRDPLQPIVACKKYEALVRKADQLFSSHYLQGHLTERGRVFLQYGPPDNRVVAENEVGIYPYEIWQYYKIKGQSNRRFIFYSPDFGTGSYLLLNSDVPGEPTNQNWQSIIHKSTDGNFQPNADFYGDRLQQDIQETK